MDCWCILEDGQFAVIVSNARMIFVDPRPLETITVHLKQHILGVDAELRTALRQIVDCQGMGSTLLLGD